MKIEKGRILITNDSPGTYTSYTLFVGCIFKTRSIPENLPIFVNCAFEHCEFDLTWLDFCKMGKQSYTEDCSFVEGQSNG